MRLITIRLVLSIVCLASVAKCDPGPNEGFTFPRDSNPSIPNVFNVTVRNNDSMVVEYTLEDATLIGIQLQCNKSVQAVVEDEISDISWTPSGPYENTGKLKYHITEYEDNLTIEKLNFCRFVLFNESVGNCSWGPWGLASMHGAVNSQVPLYFSSIFHLVASNKTQTKRTLWTDAEGSKTSLSLPAITATSSITPTCPPSGIPPRPGPIVTTQLDFWPPVADNLTFPVEPEETEE